MVPETDAWHLSSTNMAARIGKQIIDRKLTKAERKLLRKQTRKLVSLKNKEEGLEISENPTKHLVIGNGGLICGMERNTLLSLFGRYGHIQSLYMIPGKEFALLSYRAVAEAIDAYDNLNGYQLVYPDQIPKAGITFYLAYLMDCFDASKLVKCDVKPVLPHQVDLHPPGLVLVENFISKDTETKLINYFKTESVEANGACGKSMKHRKVKHYGYEFIYGKNDIDKDNPLDEPIPNICKQLIDKMVGEELIPWKPDQLTVNQYDAGQGIPPHIDTHSAFEDAIISLSLGSQVVMEFCHPDGREVSLVLPPCSLLIMKGESRYLWSHGITPRKTDIVTDTRSSLSEDLHENESKGLSSLTLKERGFRISLTFRKVLKDKCDCKFPEKCYLQSFSPPFPESTSEDAIFVPKTDLEAQRLEATHVYQVYDEIADHFSDTRHSPWPKVSKFLQELPPESLVADVGCGNGKYLGVNKSLAMFGSDKSANLIKICREKGYCAIVSDILSLPYRSNSFDACISIAVIHHLSTEERRANAIREILRIAKPGGLVLVYVWAMEQDKDTTSSEKPVAGGKAEKELNDVPLSKDPLFVESVKGNIHPSNEDSIRNHLITSSDKSNKNIDDRKIDSLLMVQKSMATKGGCTVDSKAGNNDRMKIEVNEARNVFQQQDLLVPWHFRGKQEKNQRTCCCDTGNKFASQGEQVYHRFYHVFVEGELEKLCCDVGGNTIVKSYHDKGNWCIILRKL